MSDADLMLSEFDREMISTRQVLEQVPDEKFSWKAHPRSNTMGWNVSHLVEIIGWTHDVLTLPDWDLAPPGEPMYQTQVLESRTQALDLFDENVRSARTALQNASSESMQELWSLKAAGDPLFTLPRAAVIRTFVLNHLIHHRGILCAYLRLNDLPVPGMYGPSGD